MAQLIPTDEALEEKIKELKDINVHLAEFEYLYDPNGVNSGQIDPNVLSAGGFPVAILRVIFDLILQDQLSSKYIEHAHFERQLEATLKDNFSLTAIEIAELAKNIATKIAAYFCNTWEESKTNLILKELKSFKKNGLDRVDLNLFKSDKVLLERLFEDKYGLGFLNSQLWLKHKVSLVNKLYEKIESGESVGPFNGAYLKNLASFIENYIDALKLTNPPEKTKFADYKVEWESDLGYILKYQIEKKYPNYSVDVFCDLFTKSELFSLIPLKSHTLFLSKGKFKLIYDLLHKNLKIDTDHSLTLKSAENQFPYIQFMKNSGKTYCHFSESLVVEIKDTWNTQTTLTENYNQYAYLYDSYPKSKIDINKASDRKMFLSSFLNAKASIFKIYEEMEENYGLKVERPKTLLTNQKDIKITQVQDLIMNNKLVIKEGGYCSTGGSEVEVIDIDSQQASINTPYITTVIQTYVPSNIFSLDNMDMHAHIRNVSVLNSKGECVHLGFVSKASFQGKGNSSAYRTIVLAFDNYGNFTHGIYHNPNPEYFYKLEDHNITLNMTDKEFKNLLSKVRNNWLLAMFYTNKYFENDFKDKTNILVNNKVVDKRYHLK